MTDLRNEFWNAVDKANRQMDFEEALRMAKGSSFEEEPDNSNFMNKLIMETAKSESAIKIEKFEYDNSDSVDLMIDITKRSPKQIERDRKEAEEWKRIELEREKARLKWKKTIKSYERFNQANYLTQTQQSFSSSSTSAGAGGARRPFIEEEDYYGPDYTDLDYLD